jgi:hypothetical protein
MAIDIPSDYWSGKFSISALLTKLSDNQWLKLNKEI